MRGGASRDPSTSSARAGAVRFRPERRQAARESGGGQGDVFIRPVDRPTAQNRVSNATFLPRRGPGRGCHYVLRGWRPCAARSIASEAEAAPAVSYTAHAGSELTADNLGLNDLEDSAPVALKGDTDVPVAVHAMAPALPTPAPVVDEPVERDNRSLAELVADYAGTETPDAETECLARAVYCESQGRAAGRPARPSPRWSSTAPVRAASPRPSAASSASRGQFSFVRRRLHSAAAAGGSRDWRIAVAIAQIAMQDLADGAAPRALFFHARHVRPGWRRPASRRSGITSSTAEPVDGRPPQRGFPPFPFHSSLSCMATLGRIA